MSALIKSLKSLFLMVFVLLSGIIFAQNQAKIDSLKYIVSNNDRNDTIQIMNLTNLGSEYEYFDNDSLLYYYHQDQVD